MKLGRWAFITFGAGLPNWRGAARRLSQEAESSGWFNRVLHITDRDLKRTFPQFYRDHASILTLRTRGYGFWIWKSYLIRQIWTQLGPNYDGIMYLDAGCQLNLPSPEARKRFASYFERSADLGLFAVHLPTHSEQEWSRVTTMDRLGLERADRESPQVQAGVLIVTGKTMSLVDQWHELSIEGGYTYVIDAPAKERNSPAFRAHRHDQSIFSALVKKNAIPTIPDETFWAPNWSTSGKDFPIWAARNRTSVSILASDPRSRVVRLVEKGYSRGVSRLLGGPVR